MLILVDFFSQWTQPICVPAMKSSTMKEVLRAISPWNGVTKVLASTDITGFQNDNLCWSQTTSCIPYKNLPYHPQRKG